MQTRVVQHCCCRGTWDNPKRIIWPSWKHRGESWCGSDSKDFLSNRTNLLTGSQGCRMWFVPLTGYQLNTKSIYIIIIIILIIVIVIVVIIIIIIFRRSSSRSKSTWRNDTFIYLFIYFYIPSLWFSDRSWVKMHPSSLTFFSHIFLLSFPSFHRKRVITFHLHCTISFLNQSMFSLSTEGGVCYTAHMAKIYIATEKHNTKRGNRIKKIKIMVSFFRLLTILIEICFFF